MNNSTAAHKNITPEFTYPQPKNKITIGDIIRPAHGINPDANTFSEVIGKIERLALYHNILT